MSTAAVPDAGTEYRLSRSHLEWGVVCALFFGVMGVISVLAALANADGSFPYPVGYAIGLGGIYFSLTVVGGLLILSYHRHRLFVGPGMVRSTGCFSTRQIGLADVTRALWKSQIKGGSVLLYVGAERLRVHFANYTYTERSELIAFFRTALPTEIQEGWDRFEARCMPPRVDYRQLRSEIHRLLRFMVIAWGIALPFMYALMIWLKLAGGLPNGNWFVVGIFPLGVAGAIVGLSWLASRGDLARARGRGDAD